jgi:Histidine phosphatase superfamily (branch 2)
MVVRVTVQRHRSRRSFKVLSLPIVVGMMTVGLMSNRIPRVFSTRLDATTGISAISTDPWYQRYPYYPPYCATPDEMAAWSVPPLSNDQSVLRVTGETRLLHVTAVARHGARTPYTPYLNCWEDYATNPETAVWDCALHTYLSTPPTDDNVQDLPMFLLEKRYDALHEPMSNYLNGTCQVGQLLEPGYEQELRNGQFLRSAYVYTEGTFDHDKRMRLLGVGSQANGNVWDHVHYRVDDESRTTQSGQVILQGLFGPEMTAYFAQHQSLPVIPLHTADYNRDVLEPNEDVCPRLTEIRTRNEASSEYKAYNQSDEAVLLRRFQQQVLRIPDRSRDMDAIDCLMTTMCTDRPLPDAVNDYRPAATAELQNKTAWSEEYGHDLLQRLYEFETKLFVLNAIAENAEYSKLGMSFLWDEIMTKLNAHVRRNNRSVNHNNNGSDDSSFPHEKLLLIAGHDTTIIPLLATLGVWNDTTWPTYASMILLELHQLNIDGKTSRKVFRSDYAFRLIYNGAVITPQIPKCPLDLELCDISILQELVVTSGDCARQHAATVPYRDAVTRTREIVSSPQGFIYLLLLVSGSAVAGGVAVFVYLSHSTLPHKQARYLRPHQRRPSYGDEGSSYNESGNGYHDNSEDPSEKSLT